MFAKLILFVLFHSSTAVIHKLNDSDYALIPPLFHLDNYEECFDGPDAIYCTAEFVLVSDEPSQLLTMIQESSALSHTRYNHTLLRHGYCMNKSCKKFYNNSEGDLRLSLEACVNESLFIKYKLKALVLDNLDCSKRDREQPIEYLDISVAVICIVILMVNLIGSLCDFYLEKGIHCGGVRYLCCFSIFRNWKKLVASPMEGQNLRLQALKGIHGVRTLCTLYFITGHSLALAVLFITNPEQIEDKYDSTFCQIFMNGTLVIQIFLVISSFLLVYHSLIHLENHALSWNMLPQQIVMRWLRLTPSYALVLGLTITWLGRLASGPFWKMMAYSEISDCRRHWWKHLLYFNNYVDGTNCMIHTWYLAADTQLYIAGVIIFLMCRTGLTRKVVLSLLFVVGMIVPTLHIYYQHLNGVLILNPEDVYTLFTLDPTYNELYKRGHTNLTGCIIGMATGYILYNWQKAGGDPNKFRKYRYLYWTLFFWGALCWYSGTIFYQGDQQQPVYVHLLFGALLKPVFGIIYAVIMAGFIIQFEDFYRSVVEWQPFVYIGRLSYSAYLLHFAFIRIELASITAIQRFSVMSIALKIFTILTGSFIAAFFFWMLVESPYGNLIREIFRKPNKQNKEENKDAVEESKKTEDETGTELNHTKI